MHTIKGDITKVTNVQAIVNAANNSLLGGGGVDGAIHRAAGPQLLEECRKLHGCKTGEAKITKAYNLPCKYVIHTVGPVWHGGTSGEADLLAACYRNSLTVAVQNGIRSVAFPSISTGVYSYPVEQAAEIAIRTVNQFFIEHIGEIDYVYWVLFDDHTLSVYQNELIRLQDAGDLYLDYLMEHDSQFAQAVLDAMGLDNLGVVAPHKMKYYNRYNIDWLAQAVDEGRPLKYVTFWQADPGEENNIFSQWYQGNPFYVNGRKYDTAEQYMMSEKALLFHALDSYAQIMNEPNPAKCKKLGRDVKGFKDAVWADAFREIIFHGNLGKMQSDISFVNALLETEDAVLIEASPLDDIYGAGLSKQNLLNADGSLKVHPYQWHKKDSTKQAENHLGFVLMGVRDLFCDLMGISTAPEDQGDGNYVETSFESTEDDMSDGSGFRASNGLVVNDDFWERIKGREPTEEEYLAIGEWKNKANVEGLIKANGSGNEG